MVTERMATDPSGQLDLQTLGVEVEHGEIDTVIVAFTDLYGRLIGKRFTASCFLDSVAKSGTHACNYLLTVDMEMEPVEDYAFANWTRGYGDFHLVPDLATFAPRQLVEQHGVGLV